MRLLYNNRIGVHLHMPKTSTAQLRALKKYQKKNIVRVDLNLHRTNDADILEKLGTVDSKQGYIKKLIRDDMKRESE